MKTTHFFAVTAVAYLSFGAIAVQSAPTAAPPSWTTGERIADWFGGIATRLRALEERHLDQDVANLDKRVLQLESQVAALQQAHAAEVAAEQKREAEVAAKAAEQASHLQAERKSTLGNGKSIHSAAH